MPIEAGDPDRRLRFGVLGCADIAGRRLIPALLGEPQVQLVAVASRKAAKAARFAERFGCEAVHGYEALLARTDLDAVYVPLPSGLHAEWVERALRAGRHVLAEKPLTTRPSTTRRLVALARERNLVLAENFMFIHHPQHEQVRRQVAAGAIGSVHGFRAAFSIPARPEADIRYRADLGGGALLDVAGYPLRAARLLLDGELEVIGATLRPDPRRGVDLGGAALLRTDDGVWVQLDFGLDDAYRCEYQILGSAGTISVARAFTPPADLAPDLRIDRGTGEDRLRLPAADQWALAVAAFVTTVRSGTGSTAPGEDALAQAVLLEGIRAAASDRPPPQAGRSVVGRVQ